jgi:ubiquinone/menaquinone biosynthesis C-methylase UbiE
MNSIKNAIKADWENAPYYSLVENKSAMDYFWTNDIFIKPFSNLNLDRTCELACGHGRHANHVLKNFAVGHLTLVDINQSNIHACKRRFSGFKNIDYVVNSGSDLSQIPSNSLSSLFCYDAMVHFEYDDVAQYLFEIERVLDHSGKALLHHSNNDSQPGNLYSENIHWRNFMSDKLFKHMAMRAGLHVVHQTVFSWGDANDLDCLSLVEKR